MRYLSAFVPCIISEGFFIGLLVLVLSALPIADLFDNYMQQDAHEFLNYLLNTVADILQEETTQEKQNGKLKNGSTTSDAEESNKIEPTWVHDIFQGTLTNETRCLNCETVSSLINPVLCDILDALYFYYRSLAHKGEVAWPSSQPNLGAEHTPFRVEFMFHLITSLVCQEKVMHLQKMYLAAVCSRKVCAMIFMTNVSRS